MGFVVLHYSCSKVILLLELNLYSTMAAILPLNTFNVECLKGSILGPLLFWLYINDLCGFVAYINVDFILFADDTNIFLRPKSTDGNCE